MKKSLDIICKEKGINTWKDLIELINDKRVETIKISSGHSYPSSFVISMKSNYDNLRNNTTLTNFSNKTGLTNIIKGTTNNSTIYLEELFLKGNSLQDLENDLKETYKYEEELKLKISIMKKFEFEEFDDLMLKAYKIYENLNCDTINQFKSIYKSLL